MGTWPLVAADLAPRGVRGRGRPVLRVLRSAPIPVHAVLELGSGGGHRRPPQGALHPDPGRPVGRPCSPCPAGGTPPATTSGATCGRPAGEDFDAVFVHDAVDYMTSEDDLLAGRSRRRSCTAGPAARPLRSELHAGDVEGGQRLRGRRRARRPGRPLPGMVWIPTRPTPSPDRVRVPAPRRRRDGAVGTRDAPQRAVRPRPLAGGPRRAGSARRSSRRRPARTARHGTSSSGTGRRRRRYLPSAARSSVGWSVQGSCWPGAKRGVGMIECSEVIGWPSV